ncbi:sigma-70 family RNA polymerase sigma factor [Lactobacillus sp. YT155]|uniref:sigma-70 family RNA polymerase sigma factor n=1 Tax=Lactobacillus sp. YT155 TaxID=3060955 RepID=UPI00265EE739|nr:sigma-70 family RNA polymerase sigma factor [Lactobacillus sp. YT155]MDO1604754.1 sigma-70 family RNA polymerase sigma factor [Lactobacillus sp. YT155]
MRTITDGFELAMQNRRVIYGALKKVNIYRNRFDYEDYVQEAMIIYAKCFCKYPPKLQEIDFNKYAYQKIVWSMLDLLRKECRYKEIHVLDNYEELEFGYEDCFDLIGMFEKIKLSHLERKVLVEHLLNRTPLTDLAIKLGVTARYLRKIRNNIKLKIMNERS